MIFTQGSLEREWFYSLKLLAHFRSYGLVDFSTYNTLISCFTGATVKHVKRKEYTFRLRLHSMSPSKPRLTNLVRKYFDYFFDFFIWISKLSGLFFCYWKISIVFCVSARFILLTVFYLVFLSCLWRLCYYSNWTVQRRKGMGINSIMFWLRKFFWNSISIRSNALFDQWSIHRTAFILLQNRSFVYWITLIKKKIKFSSHIRKFRWDRLQSHIWLNICAFPHQLESPS